MPPVAASVIEAVTLQWLTQRRPLILGLCGAQGVGKSTVSRSLARRLRQRGLAAEVLSLDDLYLSGAERRRLARQVHPLFRARGVPGTHDVARGLALLDDVRAGRAFRLPSFDKARDEPTPASSWPLIEGPLDILIFEGWCVGAGPQWAEALIAPINALERERDSDGSWRRHVNDALATDYARLFLRLDRLVLLAAPCFGIVARWRTEQEAELRRTLGSNGSEGVAVMSDAGVRAFVRHFERLTRHILETMPAQADLVLRLDEERRLTAIEPM